MNKRIEWIDVAKGIAAILVVVGHSGAPMLLNKVILSFHMPVFFVLSGMMFNNEKYRHINLGEFVGIKFKQLIIPYLFFSSLNILMLLAIDFLSGNNLNHLPNYMLSVLFVLNIGKYSSVLIGLWFLPCMFVTQTLFFIISKRNTKQTFVISIMLISLGCGLLLSKLLGHVMPFTFDITLITLSIFGFGNLFKKQISLFINKNSINKISFVGILTSLAVITVASSLLNNDPVYFYKNSYGNVFCMLISMITGVLMVFLISKVINSNVKLEFFGKNSLLLYCLQVNINYFNLKVISLLSNRFSLIRNLEPIHFIINTIIILLISIIFINLINKKAPFIIGRTKQLD